MKLLFTLIGLSLTFGFVHAESGSGPLQITLPSGWSVKYDNSRGIQFYALTRQGEKDGLMGLLMFSRGVVQGGREQIPGFIDSMAKEFPGNFKAIPTYKDKKVSYTKGKIIGDTFSGEFVTFTIEDGVNQAVFMFSDGVETWEGQYTGSFERWIEAQKILEALKKSG